MNIYIVRQELITDYSCNRIDEEFVFSSKKLASQQLDKLVDKEASDEELIEFRNILIELQVDELEPWDKRKE